MNAPSNPRHRILPRGHGRHPLHRHELLGLLLFFGLFVIFSLLILSSRLAPQKLTGKTDASTTVNINESFFINCSVGLATGTNLVSVPCLVLNLDRDDFFQSFSDGGTNIKAMYKYTPTTNGKWAVYNSSLPSYVINNLQRVSRTEGFYFIMAAPERIDYKGPIPPAENVFLRAGWNLVGYPSLTNRTLSIAIASINDTYLLIETLNGTEETGAYLTDTPPPGGETIENMTVYNGYWIRQSSTDTWVVLS